MPQKSGRGGVRLPRQRVDLLDYAPPQAERIYAGKMGGGHAMAQEEINKLLGDKALAGAKPWPGSRGVIPTSSAGEARKPPILFDLNIPFEVIPGVTSAIAAPAYAGRSAYRPAAYFIGVAHNRPRRPHQSLHSSLDWEKIANSAGTLVFLMGVKNLPGDRGKSDG